MTRYVRSWATAAAALAMLPAWAFAQQGILEGHVIDAGTKEPVPSVQVTVVGTQRGAVTDSKGMYRIASLSAGTAQVRAQRIGYESTVQSVTVPATGTVTLDFSLTTRAVSLDATVVTASGETQRVRESGVLTGKVDVDSLNKGTVTNASEMLQSRVPGVTVTASSGTVGGNSKIRIRGSNSLSLSNDPLIIIDGVRVNNDLGDGQSGAIGVGGQGASRFNDINPEDIANIEVVKGPAASSLYGTAAANGVIYITTKQGAAGKTRWEMHLEGGSLKNTASFPANYLALDTTDPDNPSACFNFLLAVGACTQTELDSYNPLVQQSPFQTGNDQNYGLSVSGGGDRAQYYVSGNWDKQQGTLQWNKEHHFSARANVTGEPSDKVKVTGSVGYVQSRLRLPQNDNNVLGVLGGGLLGGTDAANAWILGQTPAEISAINTQQNVDRFTGALSADWQLLPWLKLVGNSGLDFTNTINPELIPPNTVFFADLPLGQRTSNPFQTFIYTMQGSANAAFDLTPTLRSTTTVGGQYNNQTVRGTLAFGEQLLVGTGSLAGTTAQFAVNEINTGNITLGAYASEELGWRDKVFLTGGIRSDKNSAFGQNFKQVYYPSVSASWVIGEEPWFPTTNAFSSLRLRAAYGESGEQPDFRDAITFLNAVSVRTPAGEQAAFSIGGFGNPDLQPERTKEFEGGFDVGVLNQRASVSFTYYHKHTTDALISAPLAPSQGSATNVFRNIGSVQNSGIEALVNANILTRDPVQWSMSVNLSSNHSKVLDLGNGIAPILLNNGEQEHVNGYTPGGYWQRPILGYADTNGDGVLSEDEVQIGDTAVYLGTPFPTLQTTITSTLTLFKYFRINGQLDYEGGQKLLNLTESFRCQFAICAAANDPHASLADQAAFIARVISPAQTDAGYIEPATFWKLRELSLTFLAPDSFARRAGASGISLTLAGRNLHTWTKYKGFDPEVNEVATGNFTTDDFLTLPPTRYYTVRVDVTW